MKEQNRTVDWIIALLTGAVATVLLAVWPFDGVHPYAWEDTAVAAGLVPKGEMLPGLGVYLAHFLYRILPFDTALAAAGWVAKITVGVAAFLAYGIFSRMLVIVSAVGARDWTRRRLAIRVAAATGAVAFACSDAMWHVGQGITGATSVVLLMLLAGWFFTRLLERASFMSAVMTLATLGLLAAETPIGWLVLVAFIFTAFRFLAHFQNDTWETFLEPVRLQKTKWSMTFVFLGAFIFGVLLECFMFAQADGLRAAGVTAGELPRMFIQSYCNLSQAGSVVGIIMMITFVVVPLVLSLLMIVPAADEERFLPFKYSIAFFLCGLVAFLQLSPFSIAWYWNASEAASVGRLLTVLGSLLSAMTLVWALFVLGIEIFCRDYEHIETVLFQELHDDDDEDEDEGEGVGVSEGVGEGEEVVSVRLSFGRLAMALIPLVIAVIVVVGRRLPEDRRLQAVIHSFVKEVLDESEGVKYLFTDGSYDQLIRIEARLRGMAINPIRSIGGASARDAYIRQQGTPESQSEDRANLRTGGAAALLAWVNSQSPRLDETAAQLNFEYFGRSRRLHPVNYGLLVRPSGGDEQRAAESVERCHALADEIIALQKDGTWRHAKDESLKDRFLFAQFRLAVLCGKRANDLDPKGMTAQSLEELRLRDYLNAHNSSLTRLRKDDSLMRRLGSDELTPREGLEVAFKRGDFRMAGKYATPILMQYPNQPEANFAMGMGFYQEGQYSKAEMHLKAVLAERPNEPTVHNNLALVYLWTDRLDEAQAAVRKALELKPDQPEIQDTARMVKEAVEAKAGKAGKPVKSTGKGIGK